MSDSTHPEPEPSVDASPERPVDAVQVPGEVLRLCREARRVVVLTGAGMSAESGVPTFRDAQTGLWESYDPLDLATPEAFAADPAHVWAWYLWRLAGVAHVAPNAGHRALARWAEHAEVVIVTQNVDDLHERAGSEVLAHLHGSITAYRCADCATPWQGEIAVPDHPEARIEPPRCAVCGGAVRPGVVWFGELLPEGAFDAALDALVGADLVLSVGTSGLVQPAASLPDIASARGIPVIEVNPDDTEHSWGVTYAWRTTAATGLPALVDAVIAAR